MTVPSAAEVGQLLDDANRALFEAQTNGGYAAHRDALAAILDRAQEFEPALDAELDVKYGEQLLDTIARLTHVVERRSGAPHHAPALRRLWEIIDRAERDASGADTVAQELLDAELIPKLAQLRDEEPETLDRELLRLDAAGAKAKTREAINRAINHRRGETKRRRAEAREARFDPTTGERVEDPRARIERLTGGLRVTKVMRIGEHRMSLYITAEHRKYGHAVEIGPLPSNVVLDPRKMRASIFDAVAGRPITLLKSEEWDLVVEALDALAEYRDRGGSDAETWRERIERFDYERLTTYDPGDPESRKAMVEDGAQCCHDGDGRVWVHRDSFHRWLTGALRLRIEPDELTTALTHLGFGNEQIRARIKGKVRSRRFWHSPPGFLDGDGA